jgi:hypothetical protein
VITDTPETTDEGSVALIVATPVPTPVTSPDDDTDAVDELEVDHVTTPVRSAVDPSEYTPLAVSCCVSPAGTFAIGGDTVTARSTAGRTSTEVVLEMRVKGSVAVIVAVPALTAVTRPDDETVASEELDVAQLTRLVTSEVVPSEKMPVAVSCWVSPAGRLIVDDRWSACRTAGRTVREVDPEIDESGSVAVIVEVPVVTALMRPVGDTVATEEFELTQLSASVRSAVVPSENRPVADSCCFSPFGKLTVAVDRRSDCRTAGTTLSEPVPDISEVGSVTVIDVAPVVSAVTSPEEDTDATPSFEPAHDTSFVRSSVEPSESKPVAVSCSVSPFGRLALGTVRLNDCSTADTTLNDVVLEISEVGSVAVIVATPVPTAVARPEGDTDIVDGVDVDQVTDPVRFSVVPSESKPVAVSCCDSPFGRLELGTERLSDWRTAGITSSDFVFDIRDR